MGPDSLTQQQKLRIIAAHLHLVYSEGPLTRSDRFALQLQRLHRLGRDDKKPLPNVRQLCAGIKPDHEIEFIVVCPVCGQMFDCRNTGQLDHHSSDKHAPRIN